MKKGIFKVENEHCLSSVHQVIRALGGGNGEKRKGLHLARPKSPNMQELKRRFRQVLSSKVKSATTIWLESGKHKLGRMKGLSGKRQMLEEESQRERWWRVVSSQFMVWSHSQGPFSQSKITKSSCWRCGGTNEGRDSSELLDWTHSLTISLSTCQKLTLQLTFHKKTWI